MDREYLKLAYQQAYNSPDPSTQCGAVIVIEDDYEDDIVMGEGCNGFHQGVKVTEERLCDRDKKLTFIEHAERTAIYHAIRDGYTGVHFRDSTMYAPWFACADCARAIIGVGIRKVVGHKLCQRMTPTRWEASIKDALTMFDEAGVEYSWWDGDVFTKSLKPEALLFNGEAYIP